MGKHFLLITLLSFISQCLSAYDLDVKILDSETGDAVEYASIYAIRSKKGGLSNENGIIRMTDINTVDSLVISNIGYEKSIVPYDGRIQEDDTLRIYLNVNVYDFCEVEIYPRKGKLLRKGKKHAFGLFKITQKIERGECHAWEVGKNGCRNWLTSVILYNEKDGGTDSIYVINDSLSNSIKPLTHMKMRINVYDASERSKSNSIERWNYKMVNKSPIIFTYEKDKSEGDQWEYILPEPLLLPEKALVEVEFLEDMPENEYVIYRGNVFGKGLLYRTIDDSKWLRFNICTPVSLSIVEEKI